MKKRALIVFVLFLFIQPIFSQEFDGVNLDNGVSYNSTADSNSALSIPLYNIDVDGISIPIFLSYNQAGARVNDVPSSVGFNWQLHAGGEINKTINHLVDENEEGWFFSGGSEDYVTGLSTEARSDEWRFKHLFENVDGSPDVFNASLSNGDFINFLYTRDTNIFTPFSSNSRPVILKQSGDFYSINIQTDFNVLRQFNFEDDEVPYQYDNHADFTITNKNGVSYLFRKGLKRKIPFDLRRHQFIDSAEVKNYYLHKVSKVSSNEVVNFEYTTNKIKKLIRHSIATRYQSNSNLNTPPDRDDPIRTRGYYEDLSIEDVSRKEIEKITTSKETIEFVYKRGYYRTDLSELPFTIVDNNNRLSLQQVKLLDEIKIYDHNQNYITGYKFYYTDRDVQDPNYSEGSLKLKYIFKYGKNHKDFFLYKKMNYFETTDHNHKAVTSAQDVFGYPNGAFENGQSPQNLVISTQGGRLDRMPNESELKKGMLKSVVNSKGGVKEFDYQLNSFEHLYFGGLLVNSVINYDETGSLLSKVLYEYEDPEGFGLPMFDDTQYEPGEVTDNIYEDGYFEFPTMYYGWQTYFSKKDPKMAFQPLGYLTAYNTGNMPYALHKHTPISENLIRDIEDAGQTRFDFIQHDYGSFYTKVKQTKINTQTNLSENGYTIKYFRPSLSGFSLDKKLEKIEYYNNSNIKLKETLFNYSVVFNESLNTYKFDNAHLQTQNRGNGSRRYLIKHFPIYIFEDVLNSTEINKYSTSGQLLSNSKSEFSYLNQNSQTADYTSVDKVINYFNGVEYQKTENKFLKEYQYIQHLEEIIYILNPLIEKKLWVKSDVGWKLKKSVLKALYFNGKTKSNLEVFENHNANSFYFESNYTESYFDPNTETFISEPTDDKVNYLYDDNYKLKAKTNPKSGVSEVYQRSNDYNGLYIDAILTTKSIYSGEDLFFLKKSFENPLEAGVVKFENSFSGDHVFTDSSLSLGNFPAYYEVSYWTYSSQNGWVFNQFIHSGGALTLQKPSNQLYIDEVIVKPKFSTLTSYTYWPLIGATSTLDENGEGERIEYDLFNRPLYLFDKHKHVLKEFRYNNFKVELEGLQTN